MKTLKILSALLAVILTCGALAGCGNAKYKKYDSTGERYDCYLPDYIDVCDYNNIKVPNITYTVTDEILQRKLDRDRSIYSPDETDPDRGARYGDICDIVTECYMDGEILNSYTFPLDYRDQGHSIILGCIELDVPDIDDAIYGMKVGETKTFKFNFPDPYYRDLKKSGKEAEITLTLNHLYGVEMEPETDEFFLEHYGYTIEQYKAYSAHNLETEYNGFIATYKSDWVWEYIFANTEVKEWPEEYDNLYNELLDENRNVAKSKNKNLVQYVTENLGYEDLDAFYEYLTGYAQDLCKREMILYYIARCENLNYTEEYYQNEVLTYVKNFEIDNLDDGESFIDYQYGLDAFKERVRLNYIYDWLGDNAIVVEDITTYVNDLPK